VRPRSLHTAINHEAAKKTPQPGLVWSKGCPGLHPSRLAQEPRLASASRLFVNFFQPSFKLATKHHEGARVSKRYYPPQTPCERLPQAEIPEVAKIHLRSVAGTLDSLKLLEEIRAVLAYLIALADGETPSTTMPEAPDLAGFVAGLSSAWRAGEIRPTFSIDAKPRYLRSLQTVARHAPVFTAAPGPVALAS
jgi:hypothetical protein